MNNSIDKVNEIVDRSSEIASLKGMILQNAVFYLFEKLDWDISDTELQNKNLSLKLIHQLIDYLVDYRSEYIQLIDQTLNCFRWNDVRLPSTFDNELETRYILSEVPKQQYSLLFYFAFINSKSPTFSYNLIQNIIIQNQKEGRSIVQDFLNWKLQYLKDPLNTISIFNSEVQQSLKFYLKYGNETQKQEIKESIHEINHILNDLLDENGVNLRSELERSNPEEADLFFESKARDIFSKAETMIKRLNSILSKLKNYVTPDRDINFNDFLTNIFDIGRATVFLDDLPDLNPEIIKEFIINTDKYLSEKFHIGKILELNNRSYEIMDYKIQKDIKFKLTFYADISFTCNIKAFDIETNEEVIFNLEIQAHTKEALMVKQVEDELHTERKEIRHKLLILDGYNTFEHFIISSNAEFKNKYIELLGLVDIYNKSGLEFDEFILGKEYRRLYQDSLMVNFPCLLNLLLENISDENKAVIIRFFQNLIPLSYYTRRSIAEARNLYKLCKNTLNSPDEAEEVFNLLKTAEIQNIALDVVKLDLEGNIKVTGENVYFGNLNIGKVERWSKLLRCAYEKVGQRLITLLTPNWPTNILGDPQKGFQSNTRIVVQNQFDQIALVYNERFHEIELPGTGSENLINTNEQDLNELYLDFLNFETSQSILIVNKIIDSVDAGLVLLEKKIKDIKLVKISARSGNYDPNKVFWVDPLELLIRKYWLNKPLDQRPDNFKIPLSPYSTMTDEILKDLEFVKGLKFDSENIKHIKNLIRISKGQIAPSEIREYFKNLNKLN